MTTSITVQLSDEVAQQLQIEAQKNNTTLENIVAQRLMQPSATLEKQQHASDEAPVDYDNVLEMFDHIYAANQTGLDRVQIPVTTPITRHLASTLVKQHIIRDLEIDETQSDAPMTLYLPEEHPPSPKYEQKDYLQDFKTDDPRLKQILEKLRDPDPNIRIQGINALGDYGCELA